MALTAPAPRKSPRLEALIRQCVGWQIDELCVELGETGIILQGHVYTGLARDLCEVEAARLSGLPVEENRIEVS